MFFTSYEYETKIYDNKNNQQQNKKPLPRWINPHKTNYLIMANITCFAQMMGLIQALLTM